MKSELFRQISSYHPAKLFPSHGNFHKDYLFTETMCLMILFCVSLPFWYQAYVFNANIPSSIDTICLLKSVLPSKPVFAWKLLSYSSIDSEEGEKTDLQVQTKGFEELKALVGVEGVCVNPKKEECYVLQSLQLCFFCFYLQEI